MTIKYLRDSQRQRAYDWEISWVSRSQFVEDAQLEELFYSLCKRFKIKGAFLDLNQNHRLTYSCQLGNTISLHTEHRKVCTLIHEFAHLVVYHWYERYKNEGFIEPHGKEWLTVYMILLVKVCGYDLETVIDRAKQPPFKLHFFETLVRKHTNDQNARNFQNRQQGKNPSLVV